MITFRERTNTLKCGFISHFLELDIVCNNTMSISVYTNRWHLITKTYTKTDLRMQKIEELLEVLEWL